MNIGHTLSLALGSPPRINLPTLNLNKAKLSSNRIVNVDDGGQAASYCDSDLTRLTGQRRDSSQCVADIPSNCMPEVATVATELILLG